MDSSEIFIIVALAWALFGVSMALVMGRRGHQSFMWFVLEIAFGPLALHLAANALRHDRPGLFERLSRGRRVAHEVLHMSRVPVLVVQ